MLRILGYDVPTMGDVELRGKKVLVRVDINVPVEPETKRILSAWRIEAHAETIKELLNENCSVVVISHQGRPGEPDFIDLEPHAEILSQLLGVDVKFVRDVIGASAVSAIKGLRSGDVLLLNNTRLLPEEMKKGTPEQHAETPLVKTLAPLFDLFVLDAFATAHRPYPSIIGFPYVMPSVAGRVMERELSTLHDVLTSHGDKVFVLGGAKLDDVVKVVSSVVRNEKASRILLGGLAAELFLMASGHRLGEQNEKIVMKKAKGPELLEKAKKLLSEAKSKGIEILLPVDFAVERDGRREECPLSNVTGVIKDIGSETVALFCRAIADADYVIMKGTMGVIEDSRFREGTYKLLEAMSRCRGTVIIGGGHATVFGDVLRRSGKSNFYISTGGGAMLLFLAGEVLPAIEALHISAQKFFKE